MQGDRAIISRLNEALTNELTSVNQYFLHARMLDNWGLRRLGKIVYDESIGEMKHADKLIKRILFLNGLPNLQDLHKLAIGESALECLGADLMALSPKGRIAICEVKSGLEDYRADRKWGEYLPFCDAFYFAVAPEFPQAILPEGPGLIVADGFGGAVVMDAPDTPLAPVRRKALTLAFARLAAVRATVA